MYTVIISFWMVYSEYNHILIWYTVPRASQEDLSPIRSENLSEYTHTHTHENVSKSFLTDSLERELQMVQLCATKRSCIAI
jgi:hypothetical protein